MIAEALQGKHDDGRPSEYMASYQNSKVSASKPKSSESQQVRNSWLQKLDKWTFTDRGVFEITQPSKGSEDAPHTIHNAKYKQKLDPQWQLRHWGTSHERFFDEKKPNPGKSRQQFLSQNRIPLDSTMDLNTTYGNEYQRRSRSEPKLKVNLHLKNIEKKKKGKFEEWAHPAKDDEWRVAENGVWELVDANTKQKVKPTTTYSKNQHPLGLIDPDWKTKNWGSTQRTMYDQKVPNPSEKRFSTQTKGEKEPEPGKYLPHGGYDSDYRGNFQDFRPKSVPNIKATKQNSNWLKAQAQGQGSWRFTDRGVWEQFSATGKNMTRVSKQNFDDKLGTKHWGSTLRTELCWKVPYKAERHSLKSAAWLLPDHPFWKDKPKPRHPVRGDSEYGYQYQGVNNQATPEGWNHTGVGCHHQT